jgi:tRNA wybutosine-synthesizing protein 3
LNLQIDTSKWMARKKAFWDRLWEDLEIGYLDEDLLPLLILINMNRDLYSLSSCSGRIVVSDSTFPWSREETSIVFKKHSTVEASEILNILSKPAVRRYWINVTGPIIHVSASSLASALEFLSIAREAGYKHSGILSINRDKGVIMELTTGIFISMLAKDDNHMLYCEDALEKIIQVANTTLLRGKSMIERLINTILKHGFPIDEYVRNDVKRRIMVERLPSYLQNIVSGPPPQSPQESSSE